MCAAYDGVALAGDCEGNNLRRPNEKTLGRRQGELKSPIRGQLEGRGNEDLQSRPAALRYPVFLASAIVHCRLGKPIAQLLARGGRYKQDSRQSLRRSFRRLYFVCLGWSANEQC